MSTVEGKGEHGGGGGRRQPARDGADNGEDGGTGSAGRGGLARASARRPRGPRRRSSAPAPTDARAATPTPTPPPHPLQGGSATATPGPAAARPLAQTHSPSQRTRWDSEEKEKGVRDAHSPPHSRAGVAVPFSESFFFLPRKWQAGVSKRTAATVAPPHQTRLLDFVSPSLTFFLSSGSGFGPRCRTATWLMSMILLASRRK